MVPQIPATKTAAGNRSSTDMPARLQKDSPWSTNAKIRPWNGTIHASPVITQANSCDRMKLQCWVWEALVTASCIERALPQKRTVCATRRAHCYKRDGTSQGKSGDGRHAEAATCAKCPFSLHHPLPS